MAADIKSKARELGFEKAGIARVGDLPGAERLSEWLSRGMHAEMAWMEKAEPRLDPAKLLPGARSVVCVAKNYYTDMAQRREAGRGVISRYAWGDDYHDALAGRLRELGDFIAKTTGAAVKPCIDTSAVLEKLWARQAGLGWQGKHSNLLCGELSSWFFLGEVLVAAELEPDEPYREDHCGTCTACIDACPTGAIVEPYVVDSRRCISYLTIEHRGAIPAELRPLMGNLIFGCDLCLDVCPWNRHAKIAEEPWFRPHGGLDGPDMRELMEMEDFNRKFRGTPVLRAKREGFLRNVAIALGNSGSPDVLGALALGLRDASPLVRSHAAWAIGRLSPRGDYLLEERLQVESVPEVIAEINAALKGPSPSP